MALLELLIGTFHVINCLRNFPGVVGGSYSYRWVGGVSRGTPAISRIIIVDSCLVGNLLSVTPSFTFGWDD